MSRIQCIGTSSKVPSKDAEAGKPGVLSSRDAPLIKSIRSKKQPQKPNLSAQTEGQQPSTIIERRPDEGNVDRPQKPNLSARTEGQQPSTITERRPDEGSVDRITVDPEPASETQSAQQESSFKKTTAKHRPSRGETHAGLQALSPADTSTLRQEKSPKRSAPVGTEEKNVSAECVQKIHEPGVQVQQYLGAPECGTGRGTSEAESGDEDEDEDTAEFHAPIELLAEFLKAVMEMKYKLAKKLCQMILIYEPENPEAKHFLPLIEERLLIVPEEAQDGSSSEDNTSDDDDDDESTSGSGDDDDDDDDDTDTDSDGENSCSSSSDREVEDISQR
ncbi:glutamate-rich protein 2 [Neoarius graeffei]|uniref:glutamate-rich protein 2 n=1 Tax=Neoarius graeffei TaxID=443677 RepID=UPI00298D2152|nr:glutamate-rich protein 2 [Neoarius graeffei]